MAVKLEHICEHSKDENEYSSELGEYGVIYCTCSYDLNQEIYNKGADWTLNSNIIKRSLLKVFEEFYFWDESDAPLVEILNLELYKIGIVLCPDKLFVVIWIASDSPLQIDPTERVASVHSGIVLVNGISATSFKV